MSGIKIKFKFPSFGKKDEGQIQTIEFSAIKDYMKELGNEGEIFEYYGKLRESYEKLMKRLEEVKKAFETLENKGEKKFSPLVRKNLEKIKKIDEFNISSFQQFYTDTFYIIDKIVKIPTRIQHEALKYEDSKVTIKSLNSFLKDVDNLKKVLAMRYSKYSVVNHLENALKKQREVEDLMKKIEDIENKIELVTEEKEDMKKLLEEKSKHLKSVESSLDIEKIVKLKERINSLNIKIRGIYSDLRLSFSRARKPISKTLHSKDKKIFEFFQNFIEYPLENINEKFWKMVNILKQEDAKLNENENRRLSEFLKFAEDELKKKIDEYKKLKEEKRQLEDILKRLSSRNEELLKKTKDGKKNVEEKFKIVDRRLEKLKKERDDIRILFRKDIKTLEIMLSKASESKIRIKV